MDAQQQARFARFDDEVRSGKHLWTTLGYRRLGWGEGTTSIEWDATEEYGFPTAGGPVIQGGLVTALLDAAMGGACWTVLEADKAFPTADLRVEFLRSTRPGTVRATGTVVRRTRRCSARRSCSTPTGCCSPPAAARRSCCRPRAGPGATTRRPPTVRRPRTPAADRRVIPATRCGRRSPGRYRGTRTSGTPTRTGTSAAMTASRPEAVPSSRPARLRVGVVGAGRVGAVLGAALGRAGHEVVATSAVSAASRDRAADLLPGVPVRPVDEVVRRADLVLLTVPDDALAALVEGLAVTGVFPRGALVAHTSGRHGLAVLDPATRAGALPLALHPVLPFSGTRVDLHRLSGTCFGVTAPDALRPIAEALVVEMGGEPVWLSEQQRPLWHAALAHGANHLTTLVASSADLLRAAGVEQPAGVLAPLLGAALDGSLRAGDDALTGPVARGDAGTVQAHLEVLAQVAPEVLPSYVAMARLTADRALASGRLDPERAGELLAVLNTPPVGSVRR